MVWQSVTVVGHNIFTIITHFFGNKLVGASLGGLSPGQMCCGAVFVVIRLLPPLFPIILLLYRPLEAFFLLSLLIAAICCSPLVPLTALSLFPPAVLFTDYRFCRSPFSAFTACRFSALCFYRRPMLPLTFSYRLPRGAFNTYLFYRVTWRR